MHCTFIKQSWQILDRAKPKERSKTNIRSKVNISVRTEQDILSPKLFGWVPTQSTAILRLFCSPVGQTETIIRHNQPAEIAPHYDHNILRWRGSGWLLCFWLSPAILKYETASSALVWSGLVWSATIQSWQGRSFNPTWCELGSIGCIGLRKKPGASDKCL